MVVTTPLFSKRKYFGIDSSHSPALAVHYRDALASGGPEKVPHCPFHRRAFEEMRICAAEEPRRIGKQEVAQIRITDQPVLYQLIRFPEDLGHVHHIEMPDIRTEQGLEPRVVRIGGRAGRPRVERIVGFAAEVEIAGEKITDFFATLDLTRGEVIQLLGGGWARRIKSLELHIVGGVTIRELLAAITFDQIPELGAVQVGGVNFLKGSAVAFFPVSDQVAVQRAGPGDTTFEKRQLQLWKSARYSGQEDRFAECFERGGEVADVVVGEIAG